MLIVLGTPSSPVSGLDFVAQKSLHPFLFILPDCKYPIRDLRSPLTYSIMRTNDYREDIFVIEWRSNGANDQKHILRSNEHILYAYSLWHFMTLLWFGIWNGNIWIINLPEILDWAMKKHFRNQLIEEKAYNLHNTVQYIGVTSNSL